MSGLSGLRVLVVEDEPLIAMMVEDMLAEIGCVVAGSVSDVPGALELVGRQPVDAVVLDVHVTGGDSYSFADEMLKRGTPIVFCTGDSGSELPHPYDRQRCVTKPFSISDLRGELSGAVADGRSS